MMLVRTNICRYFFGRQPTPSLPRKAIPVKKLKLNLEELAVVSFDTDATRGQVGTVHANEATDLCSVSCGDPFSTLYKLGKTFSALCNG